MNVKPNNKKIAKIGSKILLLFFGGTEGLAGLGIGVWEGWGLESSVFGSLSIDGRVESAGVFGKTGGEKGLFSKGGRLDVEGAGGVD